MATELARYRVTETTCLEVDDDAILTEKTESAHKITDCLQDTKGLVNTPSQLNRERLDKKLQETGATSKGWGRCMLNIIYFRDVPKIVKDEKPDGGEKTGGISNVASRTC